MTSEDFHDADARSGRSTGTAPETPPNAALETAPEGAPKLAYGVTRFRSPTQQEWLAVLQQLSDTLKAICRTQVIRSDIESQRILRSMAYARNPKEFNGRLDLLGHRVAELVARRKGNAGTVILDFGARGRRSLQTAENQHADLAAEPGVRPGRTFLKL
jgi:hypothetical protein